MEISIRALLYSFFYSILLGTFLGAVYDLVRIGRIFLGVNYSRISGTVLKEIELPLISKFKNEKKRKERKFSLLALDILVFAGDILFCIFAALVLVIFIYHSNEGKARWMIFFGAAAGFAAYYFSLGKIVMFFSQYIVFVVRSIVSYAVFFALFPIKAVFSLLLRLFRRIWMRVYTKREIRRIRRGSKIGFIG